MEAVLNLITTLGIDSTVFIQLGIFLVAYFPIKFLLFKPYFEAYKERIRRTEGSQQTSETFLEEAGDLKEQFEAKTREINEQYKVIYDESRGKALKEYDTIVAGARDKAKQQIETARTDIAKQFDGAKSQIKSEISGMGDLIVGKMMQ